MGFLQSVNSEVKKLFRSRLLYTLMFVTLLAPAAGMFVHYGINSYNLASVYILAPAKAGSLAGVLIFPLFAIYELDRAKRSHTLDILEALTDMQTLYVSKVTAITFAAAVAGVVTSIVYLPYTALSLGVSFDLGLYLASYTGITLMGLVCGVLSASGFYLISRRLDASIVLFAVWVFLGLNIRNNYLMHWIDTNIKVYSDYFGNAAALRVMVWNRLFALLVSDFVFLLGILCTRRYSKSIFFSLRYHLKKAGIVACVMAVVLGAASVYLYEPLFDNSKDMQMKLVTDEESGTTMAVSTIENETNDSLSLVDTDFDVKVSTPSASLNGRARYQIHNSSGKPQQMNFQMQPGHSIHSLLINDEPSSCQSLGQGCLGGEEYVVDIPADSESTMEITYSGRIEESRLMQDSFGTRVISEELVVLGGQALIPDLKINTKSNLLTGHITLPSGLVPVSTGNPARLVEEDEKTATWEILTKGSVMQVLASHYEVETFEAGGIDIEFYYHKDHREAVLKLDAADVIRDAVDFYTDMLGSLPYTNVPLKIVENPAALLGGNAAGNICNIGESIFSPEGFANSEFEGTNGAEVLAHEICHQWWGVTARFKQQMPWTPEGLTVFTTYKFLAHRYCQEFAQKTCVDSWKYSVNSLKNNFYFNHPEYYKIVPSRYLFNILSMNNGIVMYGQMSMQIYKAEQLLGEDEFAAALAKLYRRNKNDLSYEDFLNACNLTKEDISVE